MDRAYFASEDFAKLLQNVGIGSALLAPHEWSLFRTGLLL
jgi:hypothetical protein